MQTKVLLNAVELAHAIGVKVPTIRRWTIATNIPRIKRGRLVRYELPAVLAWLKGEAVQQPTIAGTISQQAV
jgi:hypothetical protein